MAATLFQACQQGKLSEVREILEENKPDLEAKDAQGLTALMYAAQEGHVAIVQELLSRGARPEEAAGQDFSKNNAEVASMLSSAVHNIAASSDNVPLAPVFDSHGGQQMPDGSISYVQGGGVHPGQAGDMSALHHHQMQQPYLYQPQASFFDPTQMGEQPRGHAHKDSSAANLPPPEVARLIPCKFFPNCRYGDKCLFAHPVPLPQTSAAAGPVSPGQAPVFYQPPPSYAYSPYGPPQHFYSMAPPMPMQYTHAGVPMPVHMPLPPHLAGPHVSEQGHLGQSEAFNPAFHSQPQYFAPVQGVAGYAESDAHPIEVPEATATATATASAPGEAADKADGSVDASLAAPTATTDDDKDASSPAPVEGGAAVPEAAKSTHRRQSFNSFLHHHAIPFQPSQPQQQQQTNGDGSAQNVTQPPFTRGSKGPRRGGAAVGGGFGRPDFSSSNKRADRPACYFFIRAVCKHGEECRFPHILPDGSDARGPNVGKTGGSIDANRTPNRALAAKTARNTNGAPSTLVAPAAQTQQASGKKATGSASDGAAAAQTSAATNGSAAPATEVAASKADAESRDSANSKDGANPPAGEKAIPAKPSVQPASAASNADAASATATPVEAKGATPSPAQIPSKPAVAHNGGNAQRANGQHAPKSQVNGHKGSQHGFANGNRPTFGRASNGNHGRGNGHQQNANGSRKVAQRVPNSDDFPALPNAQASSGSPPVAPAANIAQKVNFSAILSAPAPVRKAPEPKAAAAETSGDDSAEPTKEGAAAPEPQQDKGTEASAEDKASPVAKSSLIPNGSSAPDFATVAQAKAVAV
ncbi:hypothetical protein ACQY0O_007592 [Thecaphora frezii]